MQFGQMPAYVHTIFEFLGISLGFRLYLRLKGKELEDAAPVSGADEVSERQSAAPESGDAAPEWQSETPESGDAASQFECPAPQSFGSVSETREKTPELQCLAAQSGEVAPQFSKETRHFKSVDRIAPLVGAMFGALVGSKIIALANEPHLLTLAGTDPQILISGKGIVGALVGGWIGVEIAKLFCGIKERTGDVFVLPLIVGMAIGRVGCFLSGGFDKTYGVATGLPWGVDFGDGVMRHPCQVYEILFLLLLALLMEKVPALKETGDRYEKGDRFRFFMVGYMSFRFFVDFIKPVPHLYCGFDAEQVVALTVLALLTPWGWKKSLPMWVSDRASMHWYKKVDRQAEKRSEKDCGTNGARQSEKRSAKDSGTNGARQFDTLDRPLDGSCGKQSDQESSRQSKEVL